jgi:transcription elongation GreA/GreB family factor
MLWRDQPSAELDHEGAEQNLQSPLLRAFRRKQARVQQRVALNQELGRSVAPELPTSRPSLAISQMSEDVRRLLRRAESLPDTSAAELRRRVEELGPIPEVLQAIQEILRAQNIPDVDLPQYDEGERRT